MNRRKHINDLLQHICVYYVLHSVYYVLLGVYYVLHGVYYVLHGVLPC